MKKQLLSIVSVALAATALAAASATSYFSKAESIPQPPKTELSDDASDPAKGVSLMRMDAKKSARKSQFSKEATSAPQAKRLGPSRAEADVPAIYGSMIYSNSWDVNEAQYGVYKLPTAAGGSFELVTALDENAEYGGVELDGVYYIHAYENFMGLVEIWTISGYDLANGERIFNETVTQAEMSAGLAVDPISGKVYGIFTKEDLSGYYLGTIAYEEGASATKVADLDGEWAAFAIDSKGQFYGIDKTVQLIDESLVTTASNLYKIDRNDGSLTLVGPTGQLPQYTSGAAFDHKTDRLFWTVSPPDETGILCEVNTSTGAATMLYALPDDEEIAGIYIPVPPADGAPAAINDLTVSFPEGSLSGTVAFTAPSTLYDGSAASGQVDYTVNFDGNPVATGKAAYGASVSVPVTVDERGNYEVSVVLSNAEGKGTPAKVRLYIGLGVPEAPEVAISYADGKFTVNWTLEEAEDDGYLNPADLKFDVTRYPDAVTVASGISGNSYVDEVAEPTSLVTYYYTVTAHNGELESETGTSNTVMLGKIEPPYSNDFATEDRFNEFTVINVNGDNREWKWSKGEARIQYHRKNVMDDWLISAPLKLEGGKIYQFTFDTRNNGDSYTERLEVKLGTAPTVEAMTTTLIEATDITSPTAVSLGTNIAPAQDGVYYIGFHGISEANQMYLFIDNINIMAPMATAVPAAVGNLKAQPAAGGVLQATVGFTAPDTNLDGSAIKELTKIEVYNGDQLIHTFENPVPGQALSHTTSVEAEGDYTFMVVAYNKEGRGEEAQATAFIGVDFPAKPENVGIAEPANDGVVTISWDSVDKDVNGNSAASLGVKYNIYRMMGSSRGDILVEGLTTNSYTFKAVEDGVQSTVQYSVYATTARGEGEGAATKMIFAGYPYEEYYESFTNGQLVNNMQYVRVNGSVMPETCTDKSLSGVAAQDGDNGYMIMRTSKLGSAGSLLLGKISLAAYDKPAFTFYTYGFSDDDSNVIEIQSADNAGGEFKTVFKKAVNEFAPTGKWGKAFVDLAEFKDKVVELKVITYLDANTITTLDVLRTEDMLDNDLSVTIDIPETAEAGSTVDVKVTVHNNGLLDSSAYSLYLTADGQDVGAKVDGAPLRAGDYCTHDYQYTLSAIAEGEVLFIAKVSSDIDENIYNNEYRKTLMPYLSGMPSATGLVAEETEAGVSLSWNEPDFTTATKLLTEDLEQAKSWEHSLKDWTFVDVDQSPVGGIQNISLPGITPGSTTASFFIFDSNYEGIKSEQAASTVAAHSGNKYIASMYRKDYGRADDWAISPKLSGKAQTISFYAKSYSNTDLERIEVYASTGSLNTADFERVMVNTVVPNEWTKYTVDLPEGTAYFAIRSNATNAFMLMIDDILFERMIPAEDLNHKGYNVYRDGFKINEATVTATSYVDAAAPASAHHSYVVTAVYADGESQASNVAEVTLGVTDGVADRAKVEVVGHTIVVSGAEGLEVEVTAVNGMTLYSGIAKDKTTVAVSTGVYMVKYGQQVAKVIVK